MAQKNSYITKGIEKAPSHRVARVSEEIRQILARVLLRDGLPHTKTTLDPLMIGRISITFVKVSSDLQHAHIYVMTSPDHKTETLAALKENMNYFRKQLALEMTIKFIPSLTFFLDETLEKARRIDELLGNVKSN